MEELVAKIGAALLCADLGITPETREDHAAYIESWLKVLKDDKGAIFTAATTRRRPPIISTGCKRRPAPQKPRTCRRPRKQ
jgi:antirestriction protein ArdC